MDDIRPEIGEAELRGMLADTGLAVDETLLEPLRAAVQPMRATLRTAGESRLRAMLKGALLGIERTPALRVPHPAPRGPRGSRVPVVPQEPGEPAEPGPGPSLRHLLARLVALFFSAVAAMFAVMTMGPAWVFPVVLGSCSIALLVLAITGRGLGGRTGAPRESGATRKFEAAKVVIGLVLFLVTGIGPFLYLAVRSVFDPRFRAEGDPVTRLLQGVGLIVLFVIASHLWRRRAR